MQELVQWTLEAEVTERGGLGTSAGRRWTGWRENVVSYLPKGQQDP